MTEHEAETAKAILDSFNINSSVHCCITGEDWYIHVNDKLKDRTVRFDIYDFWTVRQSLIEAMPEKIQAKRPRLSIMRLIKPSTN